MPLDCQRHLFRLPESVSYVNCAYKAPLLRTAETIGHEAVSLKALPYTITKDLFFEPVKEVTTLFAKLLHVDDPDRIAIIPSVSYGMANVINNVSPKEHGKGHVVVVEEQFPSAIYPWRRWCKKHGVALHTIDAPAQTNERGLAWNEQILAAINSETVAVVLPHVHWTDGTIFDLEAIRAVSKQHGALLIIDGTQSVGALPFDQSKIEADAIICAGYKWLMGPYSFGLAYYGPHFDQGTPIEENWISRLGSEDFQNLVNYGDELQPKGKRYSVGEHSNFIMVPMMKVALEQLLTWGVENIQDYCRNITEQPIAELQAMGCLLEHEDYRAHHLFGVRLPASIDADKLQQLFQERQVFVSLRGDAIRIAPNVYNTTQDMERLVSCFRDASKD